MQYKSDTKYENIEKLIKIVSNLVFIKLTELFYIKLKLNNSLIKKKKTSQLKIYFY